MPRVLVGEKDPSNDAGGKSLNGARMQAGPHALDMSYDWDSRVRARRSPISTAPRGREPPSKLVYKRERQSELDGFGHFWLVDAGLRRQLWLVAVSFPSFAWLRGLTNSFNES